MRFSIGFLALALLLSACGQRAAVPHPPRQAPAQAVTNAPRFSDAKPHEWVGRSPDHYAVHGIDASRWQAEVDWPTAQANGVSFAYFKATEGGDIIDPGFESHWNAAGRAGVPRGAYHFYYFCRPAIEQARWFIRNVPRSKGALPPVLDMEWNAHSPTCTKRPDAAHVRHEAQVFLDALERHYGQRPIIYVTVDFYQHNEMQRLQGYEFWLRSVAGHPSEIYPGQAWSFWQYSGTGLVPGFQGKVDLNAFAGSRGDWQTWLARRQR